MIKTTITLLLITFTALEAEKCIDSYSLDGCDEVKFKLGSGMEISQYKVLYDRDGDGISDNIDKCLNTITGVKVDKDGCELISKPAVVEATQDAELKETQECVIVNKKISGENCKSIADLMVNFKNDSYKIEDDSIQIVKDFAQYLKDNGSYNVEIVGYTSSVGSENYNMNLSKKRAEAVLNMLVSFGITPDRLVSVGMGESNPIASNDTKEGRAKNRRIEVNFSQGVVAND